MDHVLNWVWQGAAVALTALVALRYLGRLRAQARYVIGAIALAAVLAFPLAQVIPAAASSGQVLADSIADGPVVAIPATWWTSAWVVIALWSTWLAIFAVRMTRAFLAVRRARQRCGPMPAGIESSLHHWNAVKDRGRRARLAVSPDVPSAAVLGGSPPIIAVSPALLDCLSPDQLDRVVIHEWAHVRRHDDRLNLLHVGARLVAGWHPAVSVLERQLRIERESACDEIAVAVTGSPKRYAACLTAIAALRPVRRFPMPAIGALSSPVLKTRIVRILAQGNLLTSRWSTRAAMVAVLVLIAIATAIGGFRLIERSVVSHPVAAASVEPAAVDERRPATATSVPRRSGDADVRRNEPAVRTARPQAKPAILKTIVGAEPEPLRSIALPPASASLTTSAGELLNSTSLHRVQPLMAPAAPPVAVTSLVTTPPAPAPLATEDVVAPWTAAADAGVAIGRGSTKAGVATAGFFSRLGKKVARSF